MKNTDPVIVVTFCYFLSDALLYNLCKVAQGQVQTKAGVVCSGVGR